MCGRLCRKAAQRQNPAIAACRPAWFQAAKWTMAGGNQWVAGAELAGVTALAEQSAACQV